MYGSIISFSHLILRRVLILSYTKTLSCGCNYFTNNVLSCYLFALFPDLATTDHFQLEGYGRPGGHDYLMQAKLCAAVPSPTWFSGHHCSCDGCGRGLG